MSNLVLLPRRSTLIRRIDTALSELAIAIVSLFCGSLTDGAALARPTSSVAVAVAERPAVAGRGISLSSGRSLVSSAVERRFPPVAGGSA